MPPRSRAPTRSCQCSEFGVRAQSLAASLSECDASLTASEWSVFDCQAERLPVHLQVRHHRQVLPSLDPCSIPTVHAGAGPAQPPHRAVVTHPGRVGTAVQGGTRDGASVQDPSRHRIAGYRASVQHYGMLLQRVLALLRAPRCKRSTRLRLGYCQWCGRASGCSVVLLACRAHMRCILMFSHHCPAVARRGFR